MILNNVFDHYRQHLLRMVKRSTREDYNKRLAMLSTFCDIHGITSIEDIDFSKFLEWVFIGRGVAPRTHNNYRTWCMSFCRWLRQQHYIAGYPLLDVPPLKEPPKVRQPLPPSELKRVREYLSERNKHYLLAVMMEYYCFIRPDELSNIRIGDIDTKAHAIYVRAEISKNGKAEMVGLNNAVLSLMRELHVLRSPKDWYLFSVRCRPGATKLNSRMFRERWARRLLVYVTMPKILPHNMSITPHTSMPTTGQVAILSFLFALISALFLVIINSSWQSAKAWIVPYYHLRLRLLLLDYVS